MSRSWKFNTFPLLFIFARRVLVKSYAGSRVTCTVVRNAEFPDITCKSLLRYTTLARVPARIVLYLICIVYYAILPTGKLPESLTKVRHKNVRRIGNRHTRKMSRETTNYDLYNKSLCVTVRRNILFSIPWVESKKRKWLPIMKVMCVDFYTILKWDDHLFDRIEFIYLTVLNTKKKWLKFK